MTARGYIGAAWLNWLPRISLKAIDESQLRELAAKWLAGSSARAEEFIAQLHQAPELEALSRIPLLATLTLLIYKQIRRLPERRTRLFELFVDLLSGGWDLAKGILRKSQFSRDAKVRVLSCLAYNAHRRGLRKFDEAEVTNAIQWEFAALSAQQREVMINELVRDAVLAREGDAFQFRHLSFQEYLAARHCVYKPRDHKIRYAVKSFGSGDDWWREVIRYYVGMTGGPEELHRWLNTFHPGRRQELIALISEEDRNIIVSDV
jgi:predicted NACHT family NTPase